MISDSTLVFVCLHGYGNHVNSERGAGCLRKYSEDLNAIIFAYDQQGHGRSEGPRGVICKHTELVDDLVDFVTLLRHAELPDSETYSLCSAELLSMAQDREFVIVGESIGGAIALAATVRLQTSSARVSAILLFAPFLKAAAPLNAGHLFANVVKAMPPLGDVAMPQLLVPELKGRVLAFISFVGSLAVVARRC